MDAGAEDAVLYSVYPDFLASEQQQQQEGDVSSRLEHLRRACLDVVVPLVQGYVWQHAPFHLQAALSAPASHTEPTASFADDYDPLRGPSTSTSSSSSAIPLLYGQTRYGHNLEDEWFVVYLLFEISRRLPDVSIRVWDTDGEFLMIEAAYAIPRWLKPENSSNRVFIRQGAVHILPLPTSPAHLGMSLANPSLLDALKILAGGQIQTRAPEAVQTAIERRLEGYPEQSRKSMHKARCRVPLRVAQVLKHEPQMVSLVVEAFYTRDHDAMAAASRMENFLTRGPEGDPEMVTVLVCMSKAMYAQLKQQAFQAPRIYPMPPLQAQTQEDELGMKLACGFEMMYWERSRFQGEEDQPANLVNDVGWQAFHKSLEDSGYFRNLLEGSKEHRELMERAIARYSQSDSFSRIRSAMHEPVKRIDDILALEHKTEDFQESGVPESDDDSWLYKGDEELTHAMQERQKEMDAYEGQRAAGKKSTAMGGNNVDFDPSQLTETMKSFVDKVSSFEGAEVPAEDEAVSIDMETLFRELKTALNYGGRDGDLPEDFEVDSSSEMDFNDDDEGDDDAEASGKGKGKEAEATDEFMEEYSEVLEQQLTKTSIPKTFAGDKPGQEEMPIDVDLNLVKNLLESYSSQQGLPGPASNILGMMGIQLPDDSKEVQKKKVN